MSDLRNTIKKTLRIGAKDFSYFSLPVLDSLGFAKSGLGSISRLPYSLRVLLESVMRNALMSDLFESDPDKQIYTMSHVEQLAAWTPNGERKEVPFMPARVVLQDFTGVPAVVDLAAMRDAMAERGGDPQKINPLVPCDLVIDHSIQVDCSGSSSALKVNEEIEFQRNHERYRLLKWAKQAFSNFRVIPPAMGIVHQVNLEYLSSVAVSDSSNGVVFPDSCVGTDSHTTMTNGLGVLSWGVGGIEAEAVMLGQPIYMLVPDVVGIRLRGRMPVGATATDLVLMLTEVCRKSGVVGKFIEFCGHGLATLSLADRATVANMAPEQGSTVSYFPVDQETLRYLRATGRSDESVELVHRYYVEQGLFIDNYDVEPEFTSLIDFDLSTVEPSLAGPKRPHDRQKLGEVSKRFGESLIAPVGPKGFGIDPANVSSPAVRVRYSDGEEEVLSHGSIVIAAITSCTNTSNPSVMLGAGLLAKNAVAKGLKVARHVKTSLAPGSRVVTEYLKKAGLLSCLEQLGFYVVGYGCTTCIGNSGPILEEVTNAIQDNNIVASAVLSGNRNFEGRVSPLTRANYLASPPLVVAYALLGTTAKDIVSEPLGLDTTGKPVYLCDIWPSDDELMAALANVYDASTYRSEYAKARDGSDAWQAIEAGDGVLYPWDKSSTYIQKPPFFSSSVCSENVNDAVAVKTCGSKAAICGSRVLGKFADGVTTDHISPAGSIHKSSPAAKFLEDAGVAKADWNSYGSRRGNHFVMERGTFGNTRLRNLLVPGSEGNITIHYPSGETLSFFDAALRYQQSGIPLIILAGKEYGSGSSRDWAAKGPYLHGVKAVIAQTFERIHRSNLIGMGILPLQFENEESSDSLSLSGEEEFDILLPEVLEPQQKISVVARGRDKQTEFTVLSRIDTPIEIDYFLSGGILPFVLNDLCKH